MYRVSLGGMTTWEITEPRKLDFDSDVTRLDVSLFGGRLSVVGTDGPPRVEVAATAERPLIVALDGGRLTVRHDLPSPWPGALAPLWWWLRGRNLTGVDISVAVPYRTATALKLMSGPVGPGQVGRGRARGARRRDRPAVGRCDVRQHRAAEPPGRPGLRGGRIMTERSEVISQLSRLIGQGATSRSEVAT